MGCFTTFNFYSSNVFENFNLKKLGSMIHRAIIVEIIMGGSLSLGIVIHIYYSRNDQGRGGGAEDFWSYRRSKVPPNLDGESNVK